MAYRSLLYAANLSILHTTPSLVHGGVNCHLPCQKRLFHIIDNMPAIYTISRNGGILE